MENTKYIAEWTNEAKVGVEIHECPHCTGVFGVDWTFLDQVSQEIKCPMCEIEVHVSDAPEQKKT